jgi:hypothetical protein
MINGSVTRTIVASVAVVGLLGSTQVMAECLSVKGQIFNRAQSQPHGDPLGSVYLGPELGFVGGVSTLGVVTLKGEGDIGKLKCALAGAAAGPGTQYSELPPLPDFTHTISCDDMIDSALGVVHSQLTFDTTGAFTGFDGQCVLSFTEHSLPRDGSGKGVFDGVTDGALTIEGTLNNCTGSIDMKFTGEVCM